MLVLLLCCIIITICVVDVKINETQINTTTITGDEDSIAGAMSAVSKIYTHAINTPVIVEKRKVDTVSQPKYVTKSVPSNNSFKSYMDCKYITDVKSAQYQFKYEYLCSASGIMVVDNRYVIAIGSYYTTEIGCRIDLVMENGSIVPCIVGDCKADCHTDATNRQNPNGNVVEFIVNTDSLSNETRLRGDCSYADERLSGEIQSIRVYTEN